VLFPAPAGGKIAVKAINHYRDAVLKVFPVNGREWSEEGGDRCGRPICIKLRVGIGVPIWYDCCC
jgi:hypothetical protein